MTNKQNNNKSCKKKSILDMRECRQILYSILLLSFLGKPFGYPPENTQPGYIHTRIFTGLNAIYENKYLVGSLGKGTNYKKLVLRNVDVVVFISLRY